MTGIFETFQLDDAEAEAVHDAVADVVDDVVDDAAIQQYGRVGSALMLSISHLSSRQLNCKYTETEIHIGIFHPLICVALGNY